EVRTAPATAISLMQNEPNPFKGQTTVSFMMPDAAAATLSVYDVTGKVVSVRNINANKGLNSEVFTREQLGASGVMYYTLKSGDFTATKKMIIIE
ncbi:MAG: T9SS type A sorting domain-containing protein, partial [Saprospiraceae bacterium]